MDTAHNEAEEATATAHNEAEEATATTHVGQRR
jgi:hypothetical protein